MQTTVCLNTLQGYRFDREDSHGLYFSYATLPGKNEKKEPQQSNYFGGMEQL